MKYGVDMKKAPPDLTATKLAGEDDGDDEASSEVEAAQDILDATAAKDAKALSLALERHYELCKGKGESEPTDTEA